MSPAMTASERANLPRGQSSAGFVEIWFHAPEPLPGVRYIGWDAEALAGA